MPLRLLLSFLLLSLSAWPAHSQSDEADFPKNYYRFPINPGQQGYLSGKMGELRPNHFHAGLDIKTGGVSGWDVHAAAEGYIYRLKVSSFGYGRVLYLQHPNGQRTVYAHLDSFAPELEAYVLEEQYRRQEFEVELYPEKDRFYFKQGAIIAQSGNTGASAAPHLHFEIRTGNDVALNVLRFGFPEIQDTVAPWIRQMALRPLDMFSRVEGAFARQEFKIFQKGNDYHVYEPISAYGNIGLELYAFDRANEVTNIYGIYKLVVEVDGKEIHRHQIDRVGFEESRQINRFINYRHKHRRGESFQTCFVDDGNRLPFYLPKHGKGILKISEGQRKQVTVKCYDYYGNLATLSFTLAGQAHQTPKAWGSLLGDNYRAEDNTLYFYHEAPPGTEAVAVVEELGYPLAPVYQIGRHQVYLWNLKQGLPSRIRFDSAVVAVPYERIIPSGITYFYTSPHFDLFFPKDGLYDTLALALEANGLNLRVGDPEVPLPKNLAITYRPGVAVGNPARTHAYATNSRTPQFLGGVWDGGEIRFSTRYFGKFALLTDEEAPSISLLAIGRSQLRCRVADGLSGIDRFRATVGGEWVLLEFDHRTGVLQSKLRNGRELRGEVLVEVWDKAGNRQEARWAIP